MPPVPPAVIVIVVAFVLIFVISMIADKKSKKKFMEKMSEELQGADNVKNMYVTPDGYLYFYWPNGYMAAYKKWKLSDIWYVAVYKDTFGVYDENMKPLRGEYISQSKGKGSGGVNFPVGWETARAYADFIKQHDPRIQFMLHGKVVDGF